MSFDNRSERAKTVLARLIARLPWSASVAKGIMWRTRPRFTVGAVGVVLNAQGELLLVKHVFHPGSPWGLPGGWIERHEGPREGLKREIREETGLDVTVIEPLLVERGMEKGLFPAHLDTAFLCRTTGDVRHLSAELTDFRWMRFEDVPLLDTFHGDAVAAAHSKLNDKGCEG
jgi:8-oxo-dGTP diphosphatase